MKDVLVVEYVTGTYGIDRRYLELLPEGLSMAYAAANALVRAGYRVGVVVSKELDGRETVRAFGAEAVVFGGGAELHTFVRGLLRRFRYALVIAPPAELVRLVDAVGPRNLGPLPAHVATLSDKYAAYEALRSCGVDVPETLLVRHRGDEARLESYRFPLVIKPTMLAGSECVRVVWTSEDVGEAVIRAQACDPRGRAVVQRFIEGMHASISAVFGRGRVLLYAVNLQLLELAGGYVKYWGGVSPLRDGEIVRRVGDVLARVASCYPELRGYVGFDVVVSGGRVYVVEVNPRLTTSFVGIAELFPKVAEFMVKALEGPDELPGPVYVGNVTDGTAYYAIGCREARLPSERALGGAPSGRALLVGVTESVEAARRRVQEIVRRCYGSEVSDTLSIPA